MPAPLCLSPQPHDATRLDQARHRPALCPTTCRPSLPRPRSAALCQGSTLGLPSWSSRACWPLSPVCSPFQTPRSRCLLPQRCSAAPTVLPLRPWAAMAAPFPTPAAASVCGELTPALPQAAGVGSQLLPRSTCATSPCHAACCRSLQQHSLHHAADLTFPPGSAAPGPGMCCWMCCSTHLCQDRHPGCPSSAAHPLPSYPRNAFSSLCPANPLLALGCVAQRNHLPLLQLPRTAAPSNFFFFFPVHPCFPPSPCLL